MAGKQLQWKAPAFTESGMAYHILMFINREITSEKHGIGEDIFWESMAAKKIFRSKTAEELKTFFREKFWGNFQQFGISRKTYEILLQNINVSYEKDDTKRLKLLEEICRNSSYTNDDICDISFWKNFFFGYPEFFDPFAAWDKNILKYQTDLENMPLLLKRKIPSSISSMVYVDHAAPNRVKNQETYDVLVNTTATVIQTNLPCSNESENGNNKRAWQSHRITEAVSVEDGMEEAAVENCNRSPTAVTQDFFLVQQDSIATEKMEAISVQDKEEVAQDQEKFKTSVKEADSVAFEEHENSENADISNNSHASTSEREIEPGTLQNPDVEAESSQRSQVNISSSAESFKQKAIKNLAMHSAMNLLAAKRNTSAIAQYNHAETFFRILSVMAKAAEQLGMENIILEDWHELPDDDAKQEFEKFATLPEITEDIIFSDISVGFKRLCISFGRLLQLETKLSRTKQHAALEHNAGK